MEFSIKRVGLLLKMQWEENKKTYVLGLLAISSLVLITGLILSHIGGFNEQTQSFIYLFGILVSGILFTTSLLSRFEAKKVGIQTLMLPVSTVDRLFASLIWIIVFPIVYAAAVYPVIVLLNYINNEIIGNDSSLDESLFKLSYAYSYILVQLLALLLSLFFRKQVFIKTAVVLVLSVVVVLGVQQKVMSEFTWNLHPEKVNKSNYKNLPVFGADGRKLTTTQSTDLERVVFVDDKQKEFELELSDEEKNVFNMLSYLFILLLLATTVRKFSEKQL